MADFSFTFFDAVVETERDAARCNDAFEAAREAKNTADGALQQAHEALNGFLRSQLNDARQRMIARNPPPAPSPVAALEAAPAEPVPAEVSSLAHPAGL